LTTTPERDVDRLLDAIEHGWDTSRATLDDSIRQVAGVVAVSPFPLMRCGLREILRGRDDMKLVAEAARPRDGLRLLAELRPDVVVLDMTRETECPIEVNYVNELMRRHPRVRVLVLLGAIGRCELAQYLAAGVAGILSRESEPAAIVAGIAAVHAGKGFFTVQRHTDGQSPVRGRRRSGPGELTSRETEVLQLLVTGLTNRQIGEQLFISGTTAKFHVAGLMRKLGGRSRAEAVYRAGQLGLV
jgi:DNA-binding NarL/FixJ family response regulator